MNRLYQAGRNEMLAGKAWSKYRQATIRRRSPRSDHAAKLTGSLDRQFEAWLCEVDRDVRKAVADRIAESGPRFRHRAHHGMEVLVAADRAPGPWGLSALTPRTTSR